MKKTTISLVLLFLVYHTYAQLKDSSTSINLGNEILDYQKIHDGNLHWMKRVWREIDINEKINLVFQYNKLPLYSIINKVVSTGDLQVFSNDTIYPDELEKSLSKQEALSIGCTNYDMDIMDPESFDVMTKTISKCPTDKDIVKYRLMEDWYFDKNTSSLKVHIISIAPIMQVTNSEGIFIGYAPMYWLNFDQLRNVLVKYPVYNAKNDDSKFSWDDLFISRTFNSLVIKESNVFDRKIAEYATGIDAVLEGQRVDNEMLSNEHDVWSY
ncbi:MAG: gliding motility protein GldN [Bacteroidota bacterium]